ncbi:MAG TPA: DUF3810 domain-containing protein [Puia sp.]|nr:DUF3810 domain-containing protein [Puia sp.]
MTFRMTFRRKITWVCLFAAAVFIKVFSFFPAAVEKYYSKGLYPVIARTQRVLFGWVPFSIGDILYGAAVVVLMVWGVRSIRKLVRREVPRGWLVRGFCGAVFVLLWVYVLFNVLWGLNYNRLGIVGQLQLQVRQYSTAELQELTETLLQEVNSLDSVARIHRADLGRMAMLRGGAVRAYDSLAVSDPWFAYRSPSVKASLYSYPGLYIGFAGYYNPFTGEAQVNTMDPLFGLPYTSCHEMGHQLGYAKENEANFIGFLAARRSPDPAFGYSAYIELYLYSIRELYVRDSALAKTFKGRLAPGVRADLRELQRFNRKYQNPLEPVIWSIYGRYLQANRQPHGIVTYTEVTAWLIAYANKNGWDALKWRGGR